MTDFASLDKKNLRKTLLEARKSVSSEQAKSASISVSQLFREIIEKNISVAGYSAIRGEIDISELLSQLHISKNPVFLPVISDAEKTLKFLAWDGCELVAGKYDISCPPVGGRQGIPQLVIVPLLGFDLQGNRLGYGGGYYDATMRKMRAENKGVQFVGAAYSLQQVDAIPHEAHDERLDAVVTEKGIIRFT